MAIDFSVNTFASQQVHNSPTSSTSHASSLSGTFMGQAAQTVMSPQSLLANSAEELSFAADTTDEFELDERKEKDKIEGALADRVEMYKQLMQQAGKTEDIDNFKSAIRSKENRKAALEEARHRFPDPSDAWAALSDALSDMEKDAASGVSVDKEIIAELRFALNELENSEGTAIKAGIFAATSAEGFENLGGIGELKEFYRQSIVNFNDPSSVLEHIKTNFPNADFETAMDFLFKSLGADIASNLPSMEMVNLEHAHTNLGQVRLLQSAHTLCEKMMHRWENIHQVKQSSLTATSLMKDMVALAKERFLGPMHIQAIATKAAPPDIEREILFLQEMLTSFRQFPPRLYDGDQGFSKVMDAIQQTLDGAIEREDEFLASLE